MEMNFAEISDIEAFDAWEPAQRRPKWAALIDSLTLEDLRRPELRPHIKKSVERVQGVQSALKEKFVGKDDIIDMVCACAIAQVPMVLLGPPGTAKSLIVRSFCDCLGIRETTRPIAEEDGLMAELSKKEAAVEDVLGARQSRRLFEYLLTRYTTPEEILGTVMIHLIVQKSVYFRFTQGMAPRAEIVFLDEIFKANSAILNALLSLVNERLFYNMGEAFSVDLITAYGASNEPPDTAELGALYDRFPVRIVSDPVPEDQVADLHRKAMEHGRRRCFGVPAAPAARNGKVASTNDFRLLHKVLYDHLEDSSSDAFREEFELMFRRLRKEYGISDRTLHPLYKLAHARAMLDGRPAGTEDLAVFRYCGQTVETARILAQEVGDTIQHKRP
ncbi:MAG: hypothetical protein FJ290_20695 [Planctomycetes bacterium]|nr:hypothetical protein [Planctomycetota bacterium]